MNAGGPSSLVGASVIGNTTSGLERGWYPVGRECAEAPWHLLGRLWDAAQVARIEDLYGLRWVAPCDPVGALPDVSDDDRDDMTRLHPPDQIWSAGAAQMADNFADLGHLPFVHARSFADPNELEVPPLHADARPDGFSLVHDHRTHRLHDDGIGRRRMTIEYTAPFAVVLRLEYHDDDAVLTTLFAHQPIDDHHTALWVVLWRNDVADGRCTEADAVEFQQRVAAEDREIVESFTSTLMPLDLDAQVHTRADKPTIELRRALRRFLAAGVGPGCES